MNEQASAGDGDRHHRMTLACWTICYLSAAVFAAIGLHEPPAERLTDAPDMEFSSRRAFQHVRTIASKPRPVGSPEIAEVRGYLERTLDSMGFSRTTQLGRMPLSNGGTLEIANIAARIKGVGRPGLKAVLLMAHYDSVPNAPGASDDGSGTATLLETLRALKAGPTPKRDIIALFTDAEEVGFIGARVFVGQARRGIGEGHPWMADVGLVLNIEASGNRGQCTLFETTDQNGWLIREFARADPVPIGNSLMPALYRLTGGITDMNAFRAAGVSGLNFVFFEGKGCYHTALDTPSNLDGRSLQHQGLHALALSRHFGNLDQDDPRDPDAVYFNPIGRCFVSYPGAWVKPLAIGAAILYSGVVLLGWRSGRVKAGGLAVGFVVFPIAIALGSLATWGAWSLLKLARAEADRATVGVPVAVFFFAVALVVFITVYALLWKRTGACGLDLGALGWWTILAAGAAWFLPGGSFVMLWPLLFRLVTTALAWQVPWPAGAIGLIDLGTLPAFTIIGSGTYALFATLDPWTIEMAVAVALFVPGASLQQIFRVFDLTRTMIQMKRTPELQETE